MRIRTLWIVGTLVVLASVGNTLFGSAGRMPLMDEGTTTAMGDILPIVAAGIAVVALFQAVRALKEWEPVKIAWALLLAGIALSALAELTYGFMEAVLGLDMNVYFPSVADPLWLAGYLVVFMGLGVMLMGYRSSGMGFGKPAYYGALAAAFAAALAAIWVLLIGPIIGDAETPAAQRFVLAAYPLLDLLVLVPTVVLALVTARFGGGRVSRPWRMMSLGFILWTISDISYSYLQQVELYRTGSLCDLGWNLSYILIAAGALLQRDLLSSFNAGGRP